MATLQDRYDSGTIATQSGYADMVLLETQKVTQWAADVVYNQNQIVYATTGSGGHIFMSLVNNNVGNPVTDTTKWEDLGVGGLNQTNVGKAMRFKDLAREVVEHNADLTAVTGGGNADSKHTHSLDAIAEKNDIMLKSVYATNTSGTPMVDMAATVNVPSGAASGDVYVVSTTGTASFENRIFVPDGSVDGQMLTNQSGIVGWENISNITTTVYDGLDSTSGTYALSANQGYVLATRISAIRTLPPVGTLLMWSTDTAPTGCLICDGTAISRTTYATLFGVIGTTYGVGDGSTTFNLPDFRGMFAQGTPASGTTGTSVAAGLPEIAGTYDLRPTTNRNNASNLAGAYSSSAGATQGATIAETQTSGTAQRMAFSAAASNSIYGNSTTVQPPAVHVNFVIVYE